MYYKTEVIRQAAKLLDAVNDEDNNVIETFFNDKEKRIEVWNMLADEEKMIASVRYDEEQKEATPSEEERKSIMVVPGSYVPTLLKAIARLGESSRSITNPEFIFDDEKEELRVLDHEEGVNPSLFTILY